MSNTCFSLYPSIPSLYTPLYTPCFFLHEDLKRPRQWLLWTFKSQQRYLEVSTRSNDDFQTVFELIQDILESIFYVVSWQRQNQLGNHEIARNFYTPKKTAFKLVLCFQKSFFMLQMLLKIFFNVFFWSKGTRNIFTTLFYDQNWSL